MATQKMKDKINELYDSGMSYLKVSLELDISPVTVGTHVLRPRPANRKGQKNGCQKVIPIA